MIVIGIDVGVTGAFAWIGQNWSACREAGEYHVIDTPVLRVKKGKGVRSEYDLAGMVSLIEMAKSSGEPVVAAIEAVHSMPEQGVASSFSFGVGYGMWLGLLAYARIPTDRVSPVAWKKAMMDGTAKTKNASILRAKELFPGVDIGKKHGRAESLLIAEYRRRLG